MSEIIDPFVLILLFIFFSLGFYLIYSAHRDKKKDAARKTEHTRKAGVLEAFDKEDKEERGWLCYTIAGEDHTVICTRITTGVEQSFPLLVSLFTVKTVGDLFDIVKGNSSIWSLRFVHCDGNIITFVCRLGGTMLKKDESLLDGIENRFDYEIRKWANNGKKGKV